MISSLLTTFRPGEQAKLDRKVRKEEVGVCM